MGAALWGMSLVGPQIDVAVADDGGSSASSSGTDSSNSDAGPKKSYASKRGDDTRTSSSKHDDGSTDSDNDSDAKDNATGSDSNDDGDGSDPTDTSSATDTDDDSDASGNDSDDADTDDAEALTAATEESSAKYQDRARERVSAYTAGPQQGPSAPQTPTAGLVSGPAATAENVGELEDSPVTVAAEPSQGDPWGMEQMANEEHPWQANTADIITGTTANLQFLIDSLPVPPELRDALTGTLWTMRRAFFNLAPTMDEEYQVTSGLGTILGQATATDAEDDQLAYRIVRGPQYGTLELNADGTFTYTPDSDFDGVDTFVIEAVDLGFHLNLLDPFRGAGASASMLVNQNAIDFEFTYNDPDNYFDDEAKEALYQSAKRLSVYFLVKQKTVLTYTVNSEYIKEGHLASASSELSSEDPGFWGTVVQEKLQTGVDANGEDADGVINWNWANDWGYYPFVGSKEFDFTSTVMHELLHSFGFYNALGEPDSKEGTAWYTYDQFVVTKDGTSPIDPETLRYDPEFDPYLTGYDGGMFFAGKNAMAAYNGRLVPLWTPAKFSGSSIAHLDDNVFSGPNHAMMDHEALDTGPDNITLSPVELGILMDLGYTVVPNPWFAYPVYNSDDDEDEDL